MQKSFLAHAAGSPVCRQISTVHLFPRQIALPSAFGRSLLDLGARRRAGSLTIRSMTSQSLEMLRCDLHRLQPRQAACLSCAPKDRSAAFGRDHRIYGVFEHQNPFGTRQSATAPPEPPSPTIDGDHRCRQMRGKPRSSGQSLRPGRALPPQRQEKRRTCQLSVTTGRSEPTCHRSIKRIALR